MGNCGSRAVSMPVPALIVFGTLINAGAPAQAPEASLRIDAAIALALAENPGLTARGYDIEIARAQRDAASLQTQLDIGIEIENFAGTDSLGGFDAAETTLQLSRLIELGDKRALRAELGDTVVAGAETESALARIDLAAEVTRRFVQVVIDQRSLVLADQAIEVATQTRDVVARRVDVGRSSEAELATAEIALAQAAVDRTVLESRLESDRVRLASLWGDTAADFGSADAQLFELPAVQPFEALRERIDSSPGLLMLINDQRIADARLRLAESRRRADLSLGLGLRRLAVPGDMALVVSASMPLGGRARAAPAVAEARALRDRLPHTMQQRRLDLLALLFELRQTLEVARTRYRVLADTLVAQGERAVELYTRGFDLGSYSLLELSEAQARLVALRRGALMAAADFHLTLVDIEQLIGGIDAAGERQ